MSRFKAKGKRRGKVWTSTLHALGLVDSTSRPHAPAYSPSRSDRRNALANYERVKAASQLNQHIGEYRDRREAVLDFGTDTLPEATKVVPSRVHAAM